MKEDLKLYGNQYNYIVVSWTVGYIIGQWVCFHIIQAQTLALTLHTAIELYFDSRACS
jgi:hypothetical protein